MVSMADIFLVAFLYHIDNFVFLGWWGLISQRCLHSICSIYTISISTCDTEELFFVFYDLYFWRNNLVSFYGVYPVIASANRLSLFGLKPKARACWHFQMFDLWLNQYNKGLLTFPSCVFFKLFFLSLWLSQTWVFSIAKHCQKPSSVNGDLPK